jgi:hypothetical protein
MDVGRTRWVVLLTTATAALVAGAVAVALALTTPWTTPGDAEAVTGASTRMVAATVGGAPAAPAPVPGPETVAAGHGRPAPAKPPLRQRVVLQGAVRVSDIYIDHAPPNRVVVSFRVNGRAASVIELLDQRGVRRAVGQARAGVQAAILRAPLRRSQPIRLIIAAAPQARGGRVTIVTAAARAPGQRLRVLSPTPGSVIRGSRVVVRVEPQGFRLADQGKAVRPNEGHFHLTLDRRTYVVVYRKVFTFTGLRPGRHTLVVQPALNNHEPVPTLRPQRITFRTVR